MPFLRSGIPAPIAVLAALAGVAPVRAVEAPLWLRFAGFGTFSSEVAAPDHTTPVPLKRKPSPVRVFVPARFSFASRDMAPGPGLTTGHVFRPVVAREYVTIPVGTFTEAELAMATYAETGGLFPRQIRRGSVYDPSTWATGPVSGAAENLMLARRLVAETRKTNKRTHLKVMPPVSDRIATRAWTACVAAADEVGDFRLLPLESGERLHFFIRQRGVGRQKAVYLEGFDPVLSFGPFVNVGGGDVPKGSETFIDFYVIPGRIK